MRRLINFVVLFKEYIVLGVIILVSFSLLALSRSEELQPLRAATAMIVGSLQSSYSWIPSPSSELDPEKLRDENIKQSLDISRLRRYKAENEELRKQLGLKSRVGFKLLSAEVVGKTSEGSRNMMTLSSGATDGIRKDMAVITSEGLVGRVFATSDGYALVESLFNHSFRVAVKIARTRVDGILAFDEIDGLIVRSVPKALDVVEGDQVITSEYSSFFPADIAVGKVIRIENEPNSLFRRIYITPFAHPSRVEHCYVVLKDEALERQKRELEKATAPGTIKPQQKGE